MARTVWSNEEKAAVFAAMARIFAEKPHTGSLLALREAQLGLPLERRVVVNHQRVYAYRTRIEKARAEAKKCAPSAPPPPPAVETPPPPPSRTNSASEEIVQILGMLVDAIAESVAERIARATMLRMADPSAPMEPPRPKHDPRPTASAALNRPGVLVIGLLPSQARTIEELCSKRLDLRFLTSDEALQRERVQRAHTVLMTKFIDHAVQEKYRKNPALHFCNGGVTDLVKILDTL
jgi:hypothetical protein